jgi:hypothetical protein
MPRATKEKKGPKLKFSVFRVTLNSNKTFHTMSQEDKSNFKKVAQYLFSDDIRKFITFQEGDMSKIIGTSFHYQFELSEIKEAVHLHGIIKMTHKCKLRLDYSKIKQVIDAILGGSYLNIVASTDQEAAWLQYVNKGKSKGRIIQL